MPQLEISTYLPQIFWLVLTFAALYIIMWKLAVPSIAEVLESRQKRIEINLEKAAKAKQEAEETFLAYEDSIKEAHTEAHKLYALYAKKLSDEIDVSEAKIVDELNKKITENELEIKDAIDSTVDNVRKSAIELASDAINRLIGQVPDKKEIDGALERALKTQK